MLLKDWYLPLEQLGENYCRDVFIRVPSLLDEVRIYLVKLYIYSPYFCFYKCLCLAV